MATVKPTISNWWSLWEHMGSAWPVCWLAMKVMKCMSCIVSSTSDATAAIPGCPTRAHSTKRRKILLARLKTTRMTRTNTTTHSSTSTATVGKDIQLKHFPTSCSSAISVKTGFTVSTCYRPFSKNNYQKSIYWFVESVCQKSRKYPLKGSCPILSLWSQPSKKCTSSIFRMQKYQLSKMGNKIWNPPIKGGKPAKILTSKLDKLTLNVSNTHRSNSVQTRLLLTSW